MISARQFRFKPAQQGDLDALCGIYALVNATTALIPQRQRSVSNAVLFKRFMENLPQSCWLDAVQYGIEVRPLLLTARRTFKWLAEEFDLQVSVTRAPAEWRASDQTLHWRFVQEAAQASDAIVIWVDGLSGAHWTVVKEIDDGALSVCDSMGWATLHKQWFVTDERGYRLRAHKTLLFTRT